MPERRSIRILPLSAIAANLTSLVIAGYTGSASSAPLACASQPVAQTAFAPALQARLQQVLDRNKSAFAFPGAEAGVRTANGSWVGVTGSQYDPKTGTTVVAMVNSDIPVGPAGSERDPAPTISDQLIEAMAAP